MFPLTEKQQTLKALVDLATTLEQFRLMYSRPEAAGHPAFEWFKTYKVDEKILRLERDLMSQISNALEQ